MKNLTILLCLIFSLILIAAGASREQMALYNAITHGALVMEHIRVIDQDGAPVGAAKIWGGLQTGDGYNGYYMMQ